MSALPCPQSQSSTTSTMAGAWTVAAFGFVLVVGMEQGVAPAPPTTQPTTQPSDVAPPQQSQEVVDDAQQSSAAAPALTAGSGKDESGGTMYELNVFYAAHNADIETCQPKADDSLKVAPNDCTCLYELVDNVGPCLASIKLNTADKKIQAQLWAGDKCDGSPLAGGDTDIECDKCTNVPLPLGAGISVEVICPFDAFGLCGLADVGEGAPCIASTVVVLCALACCCGCAIRRKRQPQYSVSGSQPIYAPIAPGR